MKLTAFLIILTMSLIVILALNRMPRRLFFETMLCSVALFVAGSFLSLNVVDRLAPDRLETLLPFFPPLLPVIILVAWAVKRAQTMRTEKDSQPAR